MDRIVTIGRVTRIDRGMCFATLCGPEGRFISDFPVCLGAFQVPPDAEVDIAFMTWETRNDLKQIQLHQSACSIPNERYEELFQMNYADAAKSLLESEFYTLSLVSSI